MTYHSRAQVDEDRPGGRFAVASSPRRITGAGPWPSPRPTAAAANDPCGIEPVIEGDNDVLVSPWAAVEASPMLDLAHLRELDPESAEDFKQFAADPTWGAFAGLEERTLLRLGPLLDSDVLSLEQLGKVRDVLRGLAEVWAEACPDAHIRAGHQILVDYYDGKAGSLAEVRARLKQMGVE